MHPILVEHLVNDLHARRAAAARRDMAHPFSLRGLSRIKGLLLAISPFNAAPTADYGPKLRFDTGYPYK